MLEKNCIEVPLTSITYEQFECTENTLKMTFLLIWKGLVSDYINVFNQFLTFSELPKLFQQACLVGGGITSVPIDFKVPEEYFYHVKVLRAIEQNKVSLVCVGE